MKKFQKDFRTELRVKSLKESRMETLKKPWKSSGRNPEESLGESRESREKPLKKSQTINEGTPGAILDEFFESVLG